MTDTMINRVARAKKTAAARIASMPAYLRQSLEALPDEMILAVHDLMHEEMERRYGTKRRPAIDAALAEGGGK